jgi:hypothetical protein
LGWWHARCTLVVNVVSSDEPLSRIETSLIDKLGFLFRFWELRARHATLGEPLTSGEQLELLSLIQLVTSELRMPEPGACPRSSGALPAQLIGEGAIQAVEVRHVRAAAVLVASVKPFTPGERMVIRTADAVTGVEYVLPCSVAWVYEGSPCIVALVVDGIPTRSELTSLPEPRLSPAFAIGRQSRLIG